VRHQTRMLMTQELKVKVQQMLGYGFVAERLGHAGGHNRTKAFCSRQGLIRITE